MLLNLRLLPRLLVGYHIVFSVISHIDETPSTIFDVLYNRSNKIRFLFTSLDINLSVVVFPLTNILSIFLVPNVVVGFAWQDSKIGQTKIVSSELRERQHRTPKHSM